MSTHLLSELFYQVKHERGQNTEIAWICLDHSQTECATGWLNGGGDGTAINMVHFDRNESINRVLLNLLASGSEEGSIAINHLLIEQYIELLLLCWNNNISSRLLV